MASCKLHIALVTMLVLSFTVDGVEAQDQYKYVVFFNDKEGSPYTIEQAAEFLSEAAIQRREMQSIPVTFSDLPVSESYREALEDEGYTILSDSRWLNAALVVSENDAEESDLSSKPFVKRVIWAAQEMPGGRAELAACEEGRIVLMDRRFWQTGLPTDHGFAAGQIRMVNGQFLHDNGWRGSGKTIAVLDAGFRNADQVTVFDHLFQSGRLHAAYDFVDYDVSVMESSGHGTSVLSVMAAREDGNYLGTAPDANYILVKTEDVGSEQLVEEFNYVLGLEYADQLGADIVNTSLGYTKYNHPSMDHETAELDGDHLIASVGGDLATSKGILVINSAGNEGDSDWRYISIPADGDSVMAIGSVNPDGFRSTFSGEGLPGTGSVKPNIMAQGESVVVVNSGGEYVLANGTSFAAPIIAGLAACLWEAFPERTNMDIVRAIQQSGSRYRSPDLLSGFGIPDFQAAYALLYEEEHPYGAPEDIRIFPNPFSTNITLVLPESPEQKMSISLVNEIGQELFRRTVLPGDRKTVNLYFHGVNGLGTGLYFLRIKTVDEVFMFKMVKV